MKPEYVKISPSELLYGETNLLQSQLNLLKMLKQLQTYETLRKIEIFLKLGLKKNLGELKEFLDTLSKNLPESKFIEEQEKKEKMQEELVEKIETLVQKSKKSEWNNWREKEPGKKVEVKIASKEPELSSLDQQLEEISKKLERLQQTL